MATVRAFSALRPSPEVADSVAAVPYDVVSTSEARQQAAGNPESFLHVSRPEIDLPDGVDPYSAAVYAKAEENFARLKRSAPLIIEDSPSIYVYRLRMGKHEQTGIAACFSVAEYDGDIIRKHERTRKDKEDDRTRHILTLRAQTGPVFLTFKDDANISGIIAPPEDLIQLYDFTAPDGIRHTVWRLSRDAAARLSTAFEKIPFLYIADGHHRAASASRAAAQLSFEGAGPEAECNYFLAVAFPSDQVRILPYNRAVKDLNGLSQEEFLAGLARDFAVSPDASPVPSQKGEISMYLGGRWYGLRPTPNSAPGADPISSLDVSILQDRVLDPLLGIKDVRTDKRIDFVGGIRGTAELENLVDKGAAAVAFSLYPVTVDELIAVSDSGMIMPPKSTWFEPKLRDGLLSHLI
jgi:uncharacterized protein (DUF1015 family)